MTAAEKKIAPPYATFTSFVNLANELREHGIPDRIDPSVFGGKSGSIVYSVLNALKFLGLIDEDGAPTNQFREFVAATDEGRVPILRTILENGYPTLFNGRYDLKTITAGQFNEHIREEFGASGSTIDKIAAFFIAACGVSDVEISTHLKKRKAVAPSSSARKAGRQRKSDEKPETESDSPPPKVKETPTLKPLEYQLIDLMSEPDIEQEIKDSIWNLVQYLTARKTKQATHNE